MDDKILNRVLANFGSNPLGKPLFQVVWSDSQFEKRIGEFNDFYGPILTRSVKECRVVPKYPWIKHKWVLEVWLAPETVASPELPYSSEGTYEPIYVFQDVEQRPLPLNEDVACKIVYAFFNKRLPGDQRSVDNTAEEIREQKEYEHQLDYFADRTPWIANQMRTGEAIVVPSTYKEKKDADSEDI